MHIIGGEITYEYLGPGTAANTKKYRFTMKVYRDCNSGGANFDNPAEIGIYKGTQTNNDLILTFQVSNPVQADVPKIAPPCVTNIPDVCVERAIYTFTRDLVNLDDSGGALESYFIVYQRCCRNNTISNIFNPGDTGATFSVELSAKAMALNNNSPTYDAFPPIIICNNLPLVFNHSATDADGDQLVYSFCTPSAGGGNILTQPELNSCEGAQPIPPCAPPFETVTFISPTYTPSNPMGGNPVININSTTGLISGQPTSLGQFVVGVCVQEFRSGVLLSTVKRDFQFNVTDCTPDVYADIEKDSIIGYKDYAIISCGATTIKIINNSKDRTKINDFRWEFDLQNGTIYTNTTDWDATITFPDTGVYRGKLYLNTTNTPGSTLCADTASITIGIFPTVEANFSFDYDTCVGGPTSFTDLSVGEGIIDSWSWDFGVPNGNSNDQNPSYTYPIPGTHDVTLLVTDKNNCADETTKIINYFPAPPVLIVEPDKFLGCTPAVIFFDNRSIPVDSTYLIIWDYGDGTRDTGKISPTHAYTNPGVYDVKLQITSPIGCYIESTFQNWIRVSKAPTAGFSCDPDSAISILNNTIKFIDESKDAFRWNWDFGGLDASTMQSPTYTFQDTGVYRVLQVVTHPEGCKDSLSKIIDIRPEVRWFMPNAFTPNGDGQNDGFYGKGILDGVTDFRMTIWNRWGEMVFETANPTEQWNGRVKNTGGMSPAGVYVYLVNFTDPRGKKLEFRGVSTLVK
jgi:gliding motility-associated-like protein